MPHKTKKQKMIARYRNKLRQIQQLQNVPKTTSTNQSVSQQPSVTQPPSVLLKTISNQPSIAPETEYERNLKQWVVKDLQKTMMIAIIMITVEFFVFYATLKRIIF